MSAPYSEYRIRAYTAYRILGYLDSKSGVPGYSFGCTQTHLMRYAGIRTQKWGRMKELLDILERRKFVNKEEDKASRQWKFRITKLGIDAYKRWQPIFEELKESSLL